MRHNARRQLASRTEYWLLLAPFVLVVVPFLLVPLLFGLIASFTNYAPAQQHLRLVGLANYIAVLRDREFAAAWRNILIWVLVAVPTELAIGLGIAYLLREPFRGRGLLRVILLVPWLVSPIASGVMWHFLLDLQVGIENYFGMWLHLTQISSPLGSLSSALFTAIATQLWRNAPLAGFLLLPGLLAISSEQWEYATLEGASLWVRLRDVIVPSLYPLLLAVALLLVGSTLGTFDDILILTGGGPGTATVTPALYSYLQTFQAGAWTTGATAAWLIVGAMCLIGFVYLKLVQPGRLSE